MNTNASASTPPLPGPRRRRSLPPKFGFQAYEWLAIGVFALLLIPFWAPFILAFITACGLQPAIRGLERRFTGLKGNGAAFMIVGALAASMIGMTSYMGVRVARLTVSFAAGSATAGPAGAENGGRTQVAAEEAKQSEPPAEKADPAEKTAEPPEERGLSMETIREFRVKLMALATRWIPSYRHDVESFVNSLPKTVVTWLAARAQDFVSNTLEILFQLGFFFIFLFLFLAKGRRLMMLLLRRRPDSRPRIALWYKLAESASYTSVVSAAAIGFIQATIVTVSCRLLGYSEWGLIFFGCFVLSFAPMLGPATFPFVLSVSALIAGHTTTALWLALLCAFVGSIDNVLRAWFTAGEEDVDQLIAFVALIGAIALFGFPGLLIGPFLVSLAGMLLGDRAREGFRPL